MAFIKNKEHDFNAKLRQHSVIDGLRQYVRWQCNAAGGQKTEAPVHIGPISINLDLTSACNFRCPHCVDASILGADGALERSLVLQSIDTLVAHGLKSVILIGGGEPTLHKDFTSIVRHIKQHNLQVGIVTNGTRLDTVEAAADCLTATDWLRLSLDAATQETFIALHQPRSRVDLMDILANVRSIKDINPDLSIGYSFVIMWPGIEINGQVLAANIAEMPTAVAHAIDFGFDYISFKPCLIRLAESHKESFLHGVQPEDQTAIRQAIEAHLKTAYQTAGSQVKILESLNLKALIQGEVEALKEQPTQCHMQFFRTVLAPAGIFHCPAFRGVEKAKIGERDGYRDEDRFLHTQQRLAESIDAFDAKTECSEIGCFYHQCNCWLNDLISAGLDIDSLDPLADDNFFL